MTHFAKASTSGTLPSGQHANLPVIPQPFWRNQWLASDATLAGEPAIGGPNGLRPDNPNERVMESFGSDSYPDPLMAVDAMINGAKGRIMALREPTGLDLITTLANRAVQRDTQGDADELLQAIRAGFATFEYLRTPQATSRWNMVGQQVRLQFGYIERDLNTPNLVAWRDAFTNDYFGEVERLAQVWAGAALDRAAAPFVAVHTADPSRTPHIYGQVIGALEQMLDEINNMRLPP